MPIYSYDCPKHGKFEELQSMHALGARCPDCNRRGIKIISHPAPPIVHYKENLPLGSGSRGRYVPASETGGVPLLIPSWGAMEKEEVDWVAENAIDREKARIKETRPASKAIDGLMNLEKPGKRIKAISEVLSEG